MMNRSQRLKTFLVVWLTMFSFIYLKAQNFYETGVSRDFKQLPLPGFDSIFSKDGGSINRDFRYEASAGSTNPVVIHPSADDQSTFLILIPPNLFYIQSGIMCKGEWQLEKATHIPFRFRLGSLADCNALEGKH